MKATSPIIFLNILTNLPQYVDEIYGKICLPYLIIKAFRLDNFMAVLYSHCNSTLI